MSVSRRTHDGTHRRRARATLRGMIAQALDAILILVVAEAGGLALWRARTGAGLPLQQTLPNLAAGFCLLLGTRLALGAAHPGPATTIALSLSLFAALIAHVLDLVSRWRG